VEPAPVTSFAGVCNETHASTLPATVGSGLGGGPGTSVGPGVSDGPGVPVGARVSAAIGVALEVSGGVAVGEETGAAQLAIVAARIAPATAIRRRGKRNPCRSILSRCPTIPVPPTLGRSVAPAIPWDEPQGRARGRPPTTVKHGSAVASGWESACIRLVRAAPSAKLRP
jgi:hypothetical protein